MGTGFPVTLEWNANYSYLDINQWDPRRLKNMKRQISHVVFQQPRETGTITTKKQSLKEQSCPRGPKAHSSKARVKPGSGGSECPERSRPGFRLSASCPKPLLLPGAAQVPFPASSLSRPSPCPVSSLSQQTLLQRTGENTLPPRTTLQPLSSSVLLLAGGPRPGGHMNLILKRKVYFSTFQALWPSYQGPAAQDSRSGS